MPRPTVSPASPPLQQVGQHVTHGRSPPTSSSNAANECARRRSRRRAAGPRPCPAARLEAGLAAVRVDPDDAVGQPGQPAPSARRAASASPRSQPSLRDDDDRAARGAALPPAVEERLQRLAEPGAAGPVRDRLAGRAQRQVGVAQPQRRVTRVSRVPTVNTSAGSADAARPRGRTAAARRRTAHIEPETSSSSTSRRGRAPRRRHRQRRRLAAVAQHRAHVVRRVDLARRRGRRRGGPGAAGAPGRSSANSRAGARAARRR